MNARRKDRSVSRWLARLWLPSCLGLLGWVAGSGCSIRGYAVNQLSDAVSRSGAVFSSDGDPDLVKAASPFSLKLMESLLAEKPRHRGLLLAATSGFTQYAFAFVQEDADETEARDLTEAEALRTRARRLYLRAQGYGLRGLEAGHPGFTEALLAHPKAAAQGAGKRDVALLYWTACAWAGAISLSKDNPDLVAQVPAMEALIDRALQLDESFDHGAIHGFLIAYEMSRQGAAGDAADRARQHFERAMALSGGKEAAPLLALAESVAVQKQDVQQFDSLLQQALAINPDANPETRLVNLVMQRRARWLLSRKAELFLIAQ
ncbi:MAG TPA: TRAP transporter TatT component family protein [Candidatus Acidoferrum sp.]|nr:TRAP transporter TatT component family protein [Candidatus Acidoferrum sp.]